MAASISRQGPPPNGLPATVGGGELHRPFSSGMPAARKYAGFAVRYSAREASPRPDASALPSALISSCTPDGAERGRSSATPTSVTPGSAAMPRSHLARELRAAWSGCARASKSAPPSSATFSSWTPGSTAYRLQQRPRIRSPAPVSTSMTDAATCADDQPALDPPASAGRPRWRGAAEPSAPSASGPRERRAAKANTQRATPRPTARRSNASTHAVHPDLADARGVNRSAKPTSRSRPTIGEAEAERGRRATARIAGSRSASSRAEPRRGRAERRSGSPARARAARRRVSTRLATLAQAMSSTSAAVASEEQQRARGPSP